MNLRTQRAVRQLLALPADDWQPHDWDVFWAAHEVLSAELDRVDNRQARAKQARRRSARRFAAAVTDDTRDEVAARSGGRCEAVTPGCTTVAVHIHHKAGRGVPDAHEPHRLLHVCHQCHDYIHAHPAESMTRGWMESRLGVVR